EPQWRVAIEVLSCCSVPTRRPIPQAPLGADSRRRQPLPSGRARGRVPGLRIYRDLEPQLVLVLELHDAIDERVDREVGAKTHVAARMDLGAALADDDVAGAHVLAAELFHAAIFRAAVATVAARAYAFFVSHGEPSA